MPRGHVIVMFQACAEGSMGEAASTVWLSPSEALALNSSKKIDLAPPTAYVLTGTVRFARANGHAVLRS